MSREEIEEIYQTLLARDYARVLFADLGGLKRSGREYQARCPFHDDKTPSFSASTEEPVFYCHGCGRGGDWIDYLREKDGLPFREALEKLADAAGVELRGGADREAWAREREREKSRADLLGRVLKYFQEALFEPRGKETLAYLMDRGYKADEIKRMELGHYPGQAGTAEFLKTLDANAGELFPFMKWRDDYKAVIPYRDPLGNVKSLWGRLTRDLEAGEKEADKYKPFTADAAKDTPFNLDRAKRSAKFREAGELLAVEGYFDALAVRELAGIDNVIALGGSSITAGQLETFGKYRAREIVLALDGDKAGRTGTERALGLLAKADIRGYVLELPESLDPDGFIKDKGPEAFAGLYAAGPMGGIKWRTGRLVEKYRTAQKDPERDRAKEELLSLGAQDADPLSLKEYAETLAGLGIPLEHASEWLDDIQEKRARERLAEGYRELFRKGSELLQEGKLEDVKAVLEKGAGELRARAVTKAIELYTLERLIGDIKRTRPGLETGYKDLDAIPIRIPQEAITIIAGRPSHGKTTLLMNLLLNMAQAPGNEGRSFFFFSYEESRKSIGLKLLNILSGEIMDRQSGGADNLPRIEAYLKSGEAGRTWIEAGKLKFTDLTQSGRLWIIDEPYFVDDLGDALAYLRERHDIGAVFIDYIQKIKIKGKYQTRQLELQKISERILETAKSLSIPIILGAQLGRAPLRADKVRLDNLREAGDIEQDANLVLGLYNEAVDKIQHKEEGASIDPQNIKLTVTVLKNRNGPVNDEKPLKLNGPLWTIQGYKKDW